MTRIDIVLMGGANVEKRATVQVQISPTLWGWMLQFPTSMKICEPADVKKQYYDWVRSALN